MDSKELAKILHSAGVDAFTHPPDQSADSWNSYRLRLAGRLLKKVDVQGKVVKTKEAKNESR